MGLLEAEGPQEAAHVSPSAKEHRLLRDLLSRILERVLEKELQSKEFLSGTVVYGAGFTTPSEGPTIRS